MQFSFNSLKEEIELFTPSEHLDAKVETFDQDQKLVIVDNFWKYPDKIRKLALSIPPTYNPRINGGLAGKRVDVPYYMSHLQPVFADIMAEVFPEYFSDNYVQQCLDVSPFTVNKQTSQLPPCIPHIDNEHPGKIAAGIFLNTPEECAGGTAFYRYKGNNSYRDLIKENVLDNYDYYVQDTNKEWTKTHLVEMRYNRFVMYKQNILHTAYVPPNSFTEETPRLMQMYFL